MVAITPGGTFAYVMNRCRYPPQGLPTQPPLPCISTFEGLNYSSTSSISAYAVGPSGAVSPIGSPVSTGGSNPQSAAVHPNGDVLYVAHSGGAFRCGSACRYETGSEIQAHRINPGGDLTRIASYENKPPSISGSPYGGGYVKVDSGGKFLFVTGGVSFGFGIRQPYLNAYTIGPDGRLTHVGSVPSPVRSIVVEPGGAFIYGISGNTIVGFSVSHTGALTPIGSTPNASAGPVSLVMSATRIPVSDTTPPLINPSIIGTLGPSGSYTSNVTVSWSVSDPESGIASSSGCTPVTLPTNTAGTTLTCSVTNGAGLTNSASVTIKIAKTGPNIETVSASPSTGTGSKATLELTYSDGDGFADITYAYVLLKHAIDSNNACYLIYYRPGNSLYLLTNGGQMGALATPGRAGTLENSQCSVDLSQTSVTASGSNLTLTVALTFKPEFRGTKNIYMNALDAGGNWAGWTSRGTWTPSPNATPAAVSVSPGAGSGPNATLALTYSDSDGFADLNYGFVLINSKRMTKPRQWWVLSQRAGVS